jgi:hypothetical protein
VLLRRAELHGASYTPSSLRRQEERGWVMTACGGGWERVRQTSKKWPVLVTQVALHSEGVGSKWSTVGVIETQAMADAVGYSLQTDRVVGIVYFGLAQPEDTPASLRRKAMTELLVRVP